jgi:hypothetical protein
MTVQVTNIADVSLPLAVWLLHDEYDYVRGVNNYISATSLMKPLRQIILPGRIPVEQQVTDVTDYVARTLGHAIHDSIEKSWKSGGYAAALTRMGYPQDVIDRIRVNPTPEEIRAKNDIIPVYLEQRELKEVVVQGQTWTVGGKFDMIADGQLNDFKSTSVYSWIKGTRDADHRLQGSLYRWLNPLKVTEDYIRINYIFTDWSKAQSQTAGYPDQRVKHKDIPLMSIQETEAWIKWKLSEVAKYSKLPEDQIPQCTDEELWRSAPQYKYYSDPAKAADPAARSTRNFDDLSAANRFKAEKGGKGIVVTKPGEVKACGYCAAFNGCTQKDQYL